MATSRRNSSTSRASSRSTTAAKTSIPVDSTPEAAVPEDPVSEKPVPSIDASDKPAESSKPASPHEEIPMSTPEVIEATATPAEDNAGALEILSLPSLAAGNRPVMSDDFEVAGTIQSAGIRPIEASHMAIYGTIMNGRPISSSSLKVAEMLPGNRPIFYSDFHAVEGSETFGRPVMMSEPGLLSADRHMGDRPVFSNDLDDSSALMGFID